MLAQEKETCSGSECVRHFAHKRRAYFGHFGEAK